MRCNAPTVTAPETPNSRLFTADTGRWSNARSPGSSLAGTGDCGSAEPQPTISGYTTEWPGSTCADCSTSALPAPTEPGPSPDQPFQASTPDPAPPTTIGRPPSAEPHSRDQAHGDASPAPTHDRPSRKTRLFQESPSPWTSPPRTPPTRRPSRLARTCLRDRSRARPATQLRWGMRFPRFSGVFED